MKKSLLLGFMSLAMLSLSGCYIDRVVSENVGTFKGVTSDNSPCEVRIGVHVLPPIGLTRASLNLSYLSAAEGNQPVSRSLEKDFSQSGGPRVPNSVKILEGNRQDPRLVEFAEEAQLRLENKKLVQVQLKTGELCTSLTKQTK